MGNCMSLYYCLLLFFQLSSVAVANITWWYFINRSCLHSQSWKRIKAPFYCAEILQTYDIPIFENISGNKTCGTTYIHHQSRNRFCNDIKLSLGDFRHNLRSQFHILAVNDGMRSASGIWMVYYICFIIFLALPSPGKLVSV